MTEADREAGSIGDRERRPVGFVLLLGALTIYLGWRLIRGIVVLIGWLGS